MEESEKKPKKANNFEKALAAKKGTIPVEALRGAARKLYRLFDEKQLEEYAKPRKPVEKQPFVRAVNKQRARSF
jgi:hypothetical protein